MSVFAIPGIAVLLPLIGAVSDSLGIQATMVVMVPVSLAAGLVLGSAPRFVREDIEAVQIESLARITEMQAAAEATTASTGEVDDRSDTPG